MNRVLFRAYRDESIVALLVDLPWSNDGYDVTSYMHEGQHAAVFYDDVIRYTRPAEPSEYAPLLEELKLIGYTDLVVRRRYKRG